MPLSRIRMASRNTVSLVGAEALTTYSDGDAAPSLMVGAGNTVGAVFRRCSQTTSCAALLRSSAFHSDLSRRFREEGAGPFQFGSGAGVNGLRNVAKFLASHSRSASTTREKSRPC